MSVRTLQTHFDKVIVSAPYIEASLEAINLLLNATFLSRRDGVLIFRADKKNLHRRFIETESLPDVAAGFDVLDKQGQFKHRQLRSALRSLKNNLPYLFAYQDYPELNIPFFSIIPKIIVVHFKNGAIKDCAKPWNLRKSR